MALRREGNGQWCGLSVAWVEVYAAREVKAMLGQWVFVVGVARKDVRWLG